MVKSSKIWCAVYIFAVTEPELHTIRTALGSFFYIGYGT